MELLIGLALLGVVMYFMMIRPGQKQAKKQREMMDALDVGSRVMLGSGIYGTIRHLGEKQAIIEISPGVDLTILRAAIRTSVTPEEEEFEYSDDAAESAPDEDMEAFEADMAAAFASPNADSDTNAEDGATDDGVPDESVDDVEPDEVTDLEETLDQPTQADQGDNSDDDAK